MSDIDAVEHPAHYNSGALNIETIDVIRNAMTPVEYEGYLLGNILKYLHRYKYKEDERQDLCKAQWYLDRLIKTKEPQCWQVNDDDRSNK